LGWRDQSTDLLTAIKASAALPGMFPPVRVGEEWLVDGGVADDYPVDVGEWVGAEDLVGLWVDEQVHDSLPKRFHAGHVASASLAVMIRELSVIRQRMVAIPHTDIRIEIDGGHRVFNRIADIIQQGYDATWARIDEIRERREHGA
jgi:NTE family protein